MLRNTDSVCLNICSKLTLPKRHVVYFNHMVENNKKTLKKYLKSTFFIIPTRDSRKAHTRTSFLPLIQTWSYGACTQPLSGVVHGTVFVTSSCSLRFKERIYFDIFSACFILNITYNNQYLQWGSEIRPFEIWKHSKSALFEGHISNGTVFKWSGFSYGYSNSPNHFEKRTIQNLDFFPDFNGFWQDGRYYLFIYKWKPEREKLWPLLVQI